MMSWQGCLNDTALNVGKPREATEFSSEATQRLLWCGENRMCTAEQSRRRWLSSTAFQNLARSHRHLPRRGQP